MADKQENSPIGERVRIFLKTHVNEDGSKINGGKLAKELNIDASQLSKILKGKLSFTLDQVMDFSSRFKIRTAWLLEGEVPVYKNEKSGERPDADNRLFVLKLTPVELEAVQACLSILRSAVKSSSRQESPDQKAVLPADTLGKIEGQKKSGKR